MTAYKPIYIKGTLDGTIFSPIGAAPLTQTVPSTADGFVYLELGYAYSSTAVYLRHVHPMYAYTNGAFKEYSLAYVDLAINQALSASY